MSGAPSETLQKVLGPPVLLKAKFLRLAQNFACIPPLIPADFQEAAEQTP